MNLPQVDAISKAIESLNSTISCQQTEMVPARDSAGRILAEAIRADRDSPALDVSAMDGYAVRRSDISSEELSVAETTTAGSPPTSLPAGQAVQVFTGAGVPSEADCIIKREDTVESEGAVRVLVDAESIQEDQNIRRRGENVSKGEIVLPKGRVLTPPAMATLASFCGPSIPLYKKLRLSILNTGDELAEMGSPVEPWQIRDSNGPTLDSLLGTKSWLEIIQRKHIKDNLEEVVQQLRQAIDIADAVILTGGVSMGDTDYVPEAIQKIGGEIVFHRLPIRPGRPVLGASVAGKPILGLPGNPVSVAVTARVIALPVLMYTAGVAEISPCHSAVLQNPDDKTIPLTWFRLVRNTRAGIELVPSRGSGDVVSLGASDGFIRFEPGASGSGPWPLYLW